MLSRRVSRALRHFEESVHSLRTYLALSEPLTGMKVLAVTSSISQEGKTSVATQLALSYSKSTGRVLLIDGDMRSPDVHRIFDMERGQGLADVLQGEVSLRDAINRQWSEDIHILPAGVLAADPHRLVAGGAFEKLLDELRDEY
jgi:capsular exopolysaccharide synthesis family protein